MMMYTFNPRTPEAKARDVCEFQASLVYRVRSSTAGIHREALFSN